MTTTTTTTTTPRTPKQARNEILDAETRLADAHAGLKAAEEVLDDKAAYADPDVPRAAASLRHCAAILAARAAQARRLAQETLHVVCAAACPCSDREPWFCDAVTVRALAPRLLKAADYADVRVREAHEYAAMFATSST